MPLIDQLEELGLETGQWNPKVPLAAPFISAHYAFRGDGKQLEILAVQASENPVDGRVRDLWKARQQRQMKGLLLVIESADDPDQLVTCGPAEVDLAVRRLPRRQVIVLLEEALAEDTPQAAQRALAEGLRVVDDEPIPGLMNRALFADHTLAGRARSHPDWGDLGASAESLVGLEGSELVEGLGFSVTEGPGGDAEGFRILRESAGQARAIGLFLDRDEEFDQRSGRFSDRTPTVVALERARQENLPFVLITRGAKIRLHPTAERIGVGRKDAVETFVEAHVPELSTEDLGFVPLLFSARALVDGGSFEEVLEWSRDYSADLSARLRERIYNEVVPGLAMAVADQTAEGTLQEADLDLIYEQAMLILFRLLFVAYAEDRDLLPYRVNEAYHAHSMKTIAKELAVRSVEGPPFDGDHATDLWGSVGSLWEAVDKGNPGWGVPPYGGGLFDSDAGDAATGLATLTLTNDAFGPALAALLVERTDQEAGPVDFRSLAVRDFGTIYEGLLESSISVAPSDLKLDRRGNYVPASEDDDPGAVLVRAGEVYHHNRSGQRKATGSYFTKEFAVEHLLDKALEPALDAHLERVASLLRSYGDEAASDAFFDFRCADLAMGSGHFLVAASDRIEDRFTVFLREQPLTGVQAQVAALRVAALSNLGPSAEEYEIDDRMLLRRLVARRCLYGVDLNQIAVELARLAIWVHTFVPGLPLSFLDHTLVFGDALTGISTVDEAQEYLADQEESQPGGRQSLFSDQIQTWLEAASGPLVRLANAVDSTREDLEKAKKNQAEALEKVGPVRDLFDLICAHRRGEIAFLFQAGLSDGAVADHPGLGVAREKGDLLNALHFPVVFPEVFMRENPGFDCLIGNPPWDKVKPEADVFWGARFPGIRSMTVADMNAEIEVRSAERPDLQAEFDLEVERAAELRATLLSGPYPGLGTGDPDLHQAFSWRFWSLARNEGLIGIVLPRGALGGKGSTEWRRSVIAEGSFSSVVTVGNTGEWCFEDVDGRYTVGLIAIAKSSSPQYAVSLDGHFQRERDFERRSETVSLRLSRAEFHSWSDGLELPIFPGPDSPSIFEKIRSSPRMVDDPHALRPIKELDATNDKSKFLLSPDVTEGLWPVFGGKAISLWEPDRGQYYAWADPETIVPALMKKRFNQSNTSSSAFFGLPDEIVRDPATLPCMAPRIAYRWTTRRTDSRGLICALVPPKVILQNGIPYFFRRHRGEGDEAFLLGIMSSIPCDWFMRCYIELNLYFFQLELLPVPQPEPDLRDAIVRTAGRLASPDDRFAEWAAAVGVECGPLGEGEKDQLVARLDALVASAYGLDRDDVVHIFETFHEGWDYHERLDRTMAEFEAI